MAGGGSSASKASSAVPLPVVSVGGSSRGIAGVLLLLLPLLPPKFRFLLPLLPLELGGTNSSPCTPANCLPLAPGAGEAVLDPGLEGAGEVKGVKVPCITSVVAGLGASALAGVACRSARRRRARARSCSGPPIRRTCGSVRRMVTPVPPPVELGAMSSPSERARDDKQWVC